MGPILHYLHFDFRDPDRGLAAPQEFSVEMPQSVASQHALDPNGMERSNPFVFVGTLKHKPAIYDLASKRRAGLGPQLPDRREEFTYESKHASETEPSPKRRGTLAGLRQSLVGLDISQRVKQVVGRKRSRDDNGDENTQEQQRPCKAPAIGPAFWSRYRELHDEHNALEAMIEATAVAHAYDEGLGLDREPPSVNEEALAALEGRVQQKEWDSWDWPGGDVDRVQRFLDSETLRSRSPPPPNDFGWAGNEVDEFRLYVRAAHDDGWDMEWELETSTRLSVAVP